MVGVPVVVVGMAAGETVGGSVGEYDGSVVGPPSSVGPAAGGSVGRGVAAQTGESDEERVGVSVDDARAGPARIGLDHRDGHLEGGTAGLFRFEGFRQKKRGKEKKKGVSKKKNLRVLK